MGTKAFYGTLGVFGIVGCWFAAGVCRCVENWSQSLQAGLEVDSQVRSSAEHMPQSSEGSMREDCLDRIDVFTGCCCLRPTAAEMKSCILIRFQL